MGYRLVKTLVRCKEGRRKSFEIYNETFNDCSRLGTFKKVGKT